MIKLFRKEVSYSRIFTMLMALVMIAIPFWAESIWTFAAFDATDPAMYSYDGEDIGSRDGADAGTHAGGDISGSDANRTQQSTPFVVRDEKGVLMGNFETWDEVRAAFSDKGNKENKYIIFVTEDAVIGSVMPQNVAEITIKSAEKEQNLYFEGKTLNLTTPFVIEAQALYTANTKTAVNINTKGKLLALRNVQKVGTVKGTSKACLFLEEDVMVQGNLQSFKEVTVKGSVCVSGNVSAISRLSLLNGTVYLTAGKNFTVTNVDIQGEGVLGFPAEGKLPTVKLNGNVDGVLQLKQFQKQNGLYIEQDFAAGSKLLTAQKVSVACFSLRGEKQVCYKKGNVIYVGAEVLALYKGEEYLGTYAQWNDLRAKVNTLKDKTAYYKVVLLEDYVINGALTMPTKGRYAGLTLCNGKDAQVCMEASGGLTMTADLSLEKDVLLQVKQISGASFYLELGEDSFVTGTGNVTVKKLILKQNAGIRVGGKLTVKGTLEAEQGNELVLTYKKAASVKNTVVSEPVVIKLTDAKGNRVSPVQNTTVVSTGGNSYATQYCLLDEKDQKVSLYRRGNALKVKGELETPITLYCETNEGMVSLGEYVSFAEVKTQINRRKVKTAVYYVEVLDEISQKGSIPLPNAGTYQTLILSGKRVCTTGNLTLTGNVIIENEICKIKKAEQVPLTVNLRKYTLKISADSMTRNFENITGAAGSGLEISGEKAVEVKGKLKLQTLRLDSVLDVNGTIEVTDIYPGTDNRLDYNLSKKVSIKGKVYGQQNKLLLNPISNGQEVPLTENMKLLENAPKVVTSGLALARETTWVLYRDGNAVYLGKPLLSLFEDTLDFDRVWGKETKGEILFARLNDAMDYVNESDKSDFVIRLEDTVSAGGSFIGPAADKNVVVCGMDGESEKLMHTGSVVIDGGSLYLLNVILDNRSASGAVVLMKNSAVLQLCNTKIYTLNAQQGTKLILEGDVTASGSVRALGDMVCKENAVVRLAEDVQVNSLTLDGAEGAMAQMRLRVGKKMWISKEVTTPIEGQFIVNRVNEKDELAQITQGTVMVQTVYGQVSQFKTQNKMTGTFQEWSLIKKGDEIQTAEASSGDGEWSGDFL